VHARRNRTLAQVRIRTANDDPEKNPCRSGQLRAPPSSRALRQRFAGVHSTGKARC
jgi:hypothetical protein